jgi:hypothetical protein
VVRHITSGGRVTSITRPFFVLGFALPRPCTARTAVALKKRGPGEMCLQSHRPVNGGADQKNTAYAVSAPEMRWHLYPASPGPNGPGRGNADFLGYE